MSWYALEVSTFESRVARAAERYFTEVLPRYIDAYYGGRGYVLIARMLEAHDKDAIDEILARPAPSPRALRLALGARAQCPVVAVPRVTGLAALLGAPMLLGLFQRQTEMVREHMIAYRAVSTTFVVSIFESGFAAAAIPEARLDHEIELTVFHEMIHYFESFLPTREQPLRGREEGHRQVRHYTPAQAAVRDRRFSRRRWLKGGLGAVAACAILLVVTGTSLPRCESDSDLDVLARREEVLRSERDQLIREQADRARLEAQQRELALAIEAASAADLAYAPERVIAWLRARLPDASIQRRDGAISISGPGAVDTGPAGWLIALAGVAPTVRVETVNLAPGWTSLELALPESVGGPAPPAPATDSSESIARAMDAPFFASSRGTALRRSIRALQGEIDGLAPALGALRDVDQRAQRFADERAGAGASEASRLRGATELLDAVVLVTQATNLVARFDKDDATVLFSGDQTTMPAGGWTPSWELVDGERTPVGADTRIELRFRWRPAISGAP